MPKIPHSSPAKKSPALSFEAEGSSVRTNGKEMRETAHSSPSSAKKPPTPFPKGRREEESENLNKSAKHFMSPPVSTASRKKIRAYRKKSPVVADVNGFKEEHDKDGGGSLILDESSPDSVPVRPRSLRRRAKSTKVAADSETQKKKLGYRSSVCTWVIEFLLLLMIMALFIAFSTRGPDHGSRHNHHHHEVEFHGYQVAFQRRIKINETAEPAGAPMEEIPQAEEPMAAEQVSKITPAEPPIPKVSKITTTVENGDRSQDLSREASVRKPLIRKMAYDFDDDGNRVSLGHIFVTNAIGSVLVLVVLFCCLLIRKKKRTPSVKDD
ncbi:hypothetical protein LINPERHAP1_LOCUS16864 [Linum perenne]